MSARIEVHFVPDRSLTFAREVHLTVLDGELMVSVVGQSTVVVTKGGTFILPTTMSVSS